ncbi:MAG: tRNA (adenosine(37)-N6)-threonylcarbamoyltransferase complex transferase subunit TsaD, partial [Alphaproteobacteria bacterium]
EAFDKVAKLLDLPYPGGPSIERAAASGDAARFPLPKPMFGKPGCDFSFSGLKTAARQTVEKLAAAAAGPLSAQDVSDVAAGLQRAIADVLADRAGNGMRAFRAAHPAAATPVFVVAGGVAANAEVRAKLASIAARNGFRFVAPPIKLCTDNAAMIAWAGIERLSRGLVDALDFAPRPRWPLEELRRPA